MFLAWTTYSSLFVKIYIGEVVSTNQMFLLEFVCPFSCLLAFAPDCLSVLPYLSYSFEHWSVSSALGKPSFEHVACYLPACLTQSLLLVDKDTRAGVPLPCVARYTLDVRASDRL